MSDDLTPAARAAAWNEQYPVGTAVRYWPGRRDGESRVAETRTPAWPIPSGSALVSITGQSGGVNLTHVEPLHTEAELRERVTRELAASTLAESTPLTEYRAKVEAEVRREFVQFHDPAHCHYCAGWDYSPPCPYVAAGARAESECTVTPGQEEEIRADERTKVLAEYRAKVEAEVRERVTREIKDMKHDLGDEGWAELERRATDADWPVEWVRRRRTGNEFTTAVIETAYQVGRDRAADTAQGGGSGE